MKNILLSQMAFPDIEESFGVIAKSFWELYWDCIALGVGLGLLILVLLIIALVYIFKPKPKILSAYERAKLALEDLNTKELANKNYVSALSDILRAFIEGQYKVSALGATSEEFIKKANEAEYIDEDMRAGLSKFLQFSDTIKYSGQEIDEGQKDLILAMAQGILDNSQKQKEEK